MAATALASSSGVVQGGSCREAVAPSLARARMASSERPRWTPARTWSGAMSPMPLGSPERPYASLSYGQRLVSAAYRSAPIASVS